MNLENLIFLFFVAFILTMNGLSKQKNVKYCSIDKIDYLKGYLGRDIFYRKRIGLKCDIKNSEFTLDTESYTTLEKKIKNYQKEKGNLIYAEFNWPVRKKLIRLQNSSISRLS